MQAELTIKEILRRELPLDQKVNKICSFVDWDKEKLTEYINKYGISQEGCNKIISKFWK